MGKGTLVWIDCEMTGLDTVKDVIIKIACLITDDQLNIVAEGPELIIHQPKELLDEMDFWCTKHHGESGLTDAVLISTLSMPEAESKVLAFIQKHVDPKVGILSGNSIHMDKMFLMKDMPRVIAYLHYRLLDVSTIKELARRWHPDHFDSAPTKKFSHRALDDIKESINELQYYRNTIFVPSNK